MKNTISFLMHQLARFGALTVPQMSALCDELCSRATLYRLLSKLTEEDLAIRTMHPKKDLSAYVASSELIKVVYGKNALDVPQLRISDLAHSIAVAQSLIAASRYEYITGIATERELSSSEVKEFCFNRRPDGIIQITRGAHSYELAIEVETSLKAEGRIEEILDKYEKTFDRGMTCAGVIIVAVTPAMHSAYRKNIEKKPTEFHKRVRLLSTSDLTGLDPKVYGRQLPSIENNVRKTLEKYRTQSHDQIVYESNYSIISPPADPSTSSARDKYKESVRDSL